jgi:hypothetical protein
MRSWLLAPALCAVVFVAHAADETVAPTAPIADVAPCCQLAAGTPVELELVDALSSAKQQRGDHFALRVATPIVQNGAVLVPAGTPVVGEIVHAAHSHGGGQPGELILAARSLDLGGRAVPLRGFKLNHAATGGDTTQAAMAASFGLGPFAQFIHGHEIEIPPHTTGVAKLAQDIVLPPPPTSKAPADPASAASSVTTPPSKE